MPTIPATSSTTPQSTSGTQASGNPKATLGKDDFLKLFVAQMQHQDPMAPMDNNAMVQQMSAISSVEQLTNLTAANDKMAAQLAQTGALGLIGRSVTWTAADGSTQTGTVDKVTVTDGSPSLTVAGTPGVDPSSITQVA
jgi:flagellar basal-body rod modification protein FlgD